MILLPLRLKAISEKINILTAKENADDKEYKVTVGKMAVNSLEKEQVRAKEAMDGALDKVAISSTAFGKMDAFLAASFAGIKQADAASKLASSRKKLNDAENANSKSLLNWLKSARNVIADEFTKLKAMPLNVASTHKTDVQHTVDIDDIKVGQQIDYDKKMELVYRLTKRPMSTKLAESMDVAKAAGAGHPLADQKVDGVVLAVDTARGKFLQDAGSRGVIEHDMNLRQPVKIGNQVSIAYQDNGSYDIQVMPAKAKIVMQSLFEKIKQRGVAVADIGKRILAATGDKMNVAAEKVISKAESHMNATGEKLADKLVIGLDAMSRGQDAAALRAQAIAIKMSNLGIKTQAAFSSGVNKASTGLKAIDTKARELAIQANTKMIDTSTNVKSSFAAAQAALAIAKIAYDDSKQTQAAERLARSNKVNASDDYQPGMQPA
jgi:hypothetical protein